MSDTTDPEDDIALAGEYSLGLLDSDGRHDFEVRLGGNPALRKLVADWHEKLVQLTETIQPVQPPARIKHQIDLTLFGRRARRHRFVTPKHSAGVSFMRFLAGGVVGFGAVMVLALALPLFMAPPQVGPVSHVAQIADPGTGLVVQASLDLATGALRVKRTSGEPASGRSLELWVIAAGTDVPVSLGVIDASPMVIRLSPEIAQQVATGTLAVSDEPKRGSITGRPTNVLGTGKVMVL